MAREVDMSRVAEAARLYQSGLTARQVAARMDVDNTTVVRWLGEATRRRGPRGRTDVTDEQILELREFGLSYQGIAEMVGMSITGVRMRYYRLTGRARPGRG